MFNLSESIAALADIIDRGGRLSRSEAKTFLSEAPLALLGLLATHAKERKSGKAVFYNRNFHIEPTNVCVFNCRFCSYRRPADSPDAWDYSKEEILAQVDSHRGSGATEVHIVGGVHPRNGLDYYIDLIRSGLRRLKEAGMEAIPGGGAEIFAEPVRSRICPEKGTADEWLSVHRTAHRLGIPTNATILYGHIESLDDRIDHLDRLRRLQDETGGFNAFIPLKYRSRHNSMEEIGEVSIVEDMRMTALARLYLDNIPHIKAYWPMFGKTTAQLALAFGADDMDGTIDDSTKIYSMAGAEESKPSVTTAEMEAMIRSAGYEPVERDTFYNPVKK